MGQDGVNLEWPMYESISTNSFHTLYTDTDFADVTLACEENNQILVHKVVVSTALSITFPSTKTLLLPPFLQLVMIDKLGLEEEC